MSLLFNDDTDDAFAFSGSVGHNGDNDRADVIRAQTLLADTGFYQLPEPGMPTGWPGGELTRALQRFQSQNGLAADGLLLPLRDGQVGAYGEGETLQALQRQFDDRPAPRVQTPAQVDRFWQSHARGSSDGPDPVDGTPVQIAQAAPDPELKIGARMEPSPPPLPASKPAPVPPHKAGIFALDANRDAWSGSQSALRDQIPDGPVQREVLGRLYAEEGGRLSDPQGTAVGGITAGTLKEMREKGLLPDLPADAQPQDLTPAQQMTAYRAYLDQAFRHVGGAKALERFDPDFAHAIADAVFMHGSSGGMYAIQEAIRDSGIAGSIKVDGGMGPETFAALEKANGEKDLRDALQNKIVDRRMAGKEFTPGEVDRIGRTRPGAWKR